MDRGSALALASVLVGWLLMMLGFWLAGEFTAWLTTRPREITLEVLKLSMGTVVLIGLLVLWFEAVKRIAVRLKAARSP